MRYLVWETDCGELFNRIAVFENIQDAETFIMSCGFATDINQNLNDPVIELVDDFTDLKEWEIKEYEKRFRSKYKRLEKI